MSEAGIVQLQNARAEAVRSQIKQVQGSLKDRMYDLADLLAEAKENDYPSLWGYPSFKKWVNDSELDVKHRQAEYLIKIVVTSRPENLNIPREELKRVKNTKLNAIFSLNPVQYADVIRDLVKRAVNMPLEEVEAEVRSLKGLEGEAGTWRNFYFQEAAAAETVDTAIEDLKTVAGQEMSDADALEMICATFEKHDVAEVLEQQRKEIEGL